MNILFISNDPHILTEGHGVRNRMNAYAKELHDQGGTLHIAYRARANSEVRDGALRLHAIRTSRISMLWTLPKEVQKIIRAHDIGIVSAQDPFEHGWMALRAARGTVAKVHVQVHTDFLSPFFVRGGSGSGSMRMSILNYVRQRIADTVVPRASGIRTVSQRIKTSLMKKYGLISEPSVIPIAVSSSVIPPVPLPQHSFTYSLIAVGRLEPEKRLGDLVRVMVKLKDTYPGLGLYLIGEGRCRSSLEQMVDSAGLRDRIIFMGSRADARGLLQSADAFIQASAYEGYGLTLIEAALAGVAMLTSNVGIVGDVFTAGTEVLAAPVGDTDAFAKNIVSLIEDPEKGKVLAARAKARAVEHLAATDSSPHAIISDMLRIV